MAAWDTIIDVNDGASYGGAAWQSAIDAVAQITTALGPDDTPIVQPLADRLFAPAIATINDDTAMFLDVGTGVVQGLLVIVGNVSGAGSALLAFRTGDPSAHMTVLAEGVTNVVGGVGFLGGTTGPDGSLNINARTDLTRIHVENRTGSVRAYSVSFLATAGTFEPGSAWA